MRWPFNTFVSNAAIGEGGPIAEIPVDLVRRTFETNVFANLAIAQHVVRKFLESKTRGRIVFVSSRAAMGAASTRARPSFRRAGPACLPANTFAPGTSPEP